MIQQMKRDFFSIRWFLIFFTIIVPLLAVYRSEFTTMGLLLSAFVAGILVLNDEKFKLNKFFFSMPFDFRSAYWGRVMLVVLFGIFWILLEIVPVALSGMVTPGYAFIAILVQSCMILVLVPSSLSALNLVKGKVVRWLPLIVSYFVLIYVSLYITDVFYVILHAPEVEMSATTAYLTLAALVIFSISFMYLSSLIYLRNRQKRDLI